MSLAEQVRAHTFEHFVEPQLAAKGFATVRAGDVGKAMGLVERHAAICSAIKGKLFCEAYGVSLVQTRGKPASSATEFVYQRADTSLSPEHLEALKWFEDNAGRTVPWKELGDRDLKLAIMPKGIYRPAGWRNTLSIKIIPAGRYPDEEPSIQGGRLRFRYHQEEAKGSKPAGYYTNLGLRNCIVDGVPIGVIRQVKPKPGPLYEVLGLGQVVDWQGSFFTIELEVADAPDHIEPGETDTVDAPAEPVSLEDARTRIQRAIFARRGQAAFRSKLMAAYQGRCVISGCQVGAVLEAAHIKPYLGDHTNVVSNGLLLRADLHTLFDLRLLRIDPSSRQVVLAESLKGSPYEEWRGQQLCPPSHPDEAPAIDCLEYAWADPGKAGA